MKFFVTGASGHVGSLVVPELLGAGHEVIGLARSNESATALTNMGAQVQRGSLDDLDILRETAYASDGVIHLAFRHDLMQQGDMATAAKVDNTAVQAIGEVLAGSGKPFVGVGGTLGLAFLNLGRTGTEEDALPPNGRGETENYMVELAAQNVRTSVVRLAPTVHGPKDNKAGFIPTLIRIAREKGVAAYVEDGANRWPAVHELDAAVLFRLAVEKAPAGSRLHGVGDSGIEFKQIAETIGKNLNVPVQSISKDEAGKHFGHLAGFVVLDNPSSNDITRELLNWQPAHPGLIADLDDGDYFK